MTLLLIYLNSYYISKKKTFQYVKTESSHPNHIFKNIPKSLFIRIKRICSNYYNFLFHSWNLINQLRNRDYELEKFLKISKLVGNLNREVLFPYKDKKDNKYLTNNKTKTYLNSDFNQNLLKDILKLLFRTDRKFSMDKKLWNKHIR